LPKGCVPVFPNKCIVCHQIPNSSLNIAHNSQNPILVFFIPLLWIFGWSRVEIPICKKCKPRYRLQRWGRLFITCALIAVALWLIIPHFKVWSPFLRKVVVGVLVLLAISPYVLAEVIWPPFFDTTARSDSIDYEFASPEYAAEFHNLNAAHVLKSEVSE